MKCIFPKSLYCSNIHVNIGFPYPHGYKIIVHIQQNLGSVYFVHVLFINELLFYSLVTCTLNLMKKLAPGALMQFFWMDIGHDFESCVKKFMHLCNLHFFLLSFFFYLCLGEALKLFLFIAFFNLHIYWQDQLQLFI